MDFEEFLKVQEAKKVKEAESKSLVHVSETANAGNTGSSALDQMEEWEAWEDYMQFGFAARASERQPMRDHFGFRLSHRTPNDT